MVGKGGDPVESQRRVSPGKASIQELKPKAVCKLPSLSLQELPPVFLAPGTIPSLGCRET